MPLEDDEKLTDIASHGDTLVVLSRSYAYVATAPYKTFRRVEIPAPSGYDGKVSLFRTVWLLHSGELFGTVGVIIVDVISVILIIICVTGLAFWLTAKISVRQSLKRLKGRALKTLLPCHTTHLAHIRPLWQSFVHTYKRRCHGIGKENTRRTIHRHPSVVHSASATQQSAVPLLNLISRRQHAPAHVYATYGMTMIEQNA